MPVWIMYSTRKNITVSPPRLSEEAVCGRYLTSPGKPGRLAEGGLRLSGQYKRSTPAKPLVSVITVVLNQEATIEHCIASVLDQGYDNIEYIIIDGCSSDGTLGTIRRHEDDIDYYVSEPDSGIYDAMNKGLSLASGEYILMLNSDDWYRSDAVEILLGTALKQGVDVVHADAVIVNAEGTRLDILRGWLHDGIYTRGAPLRHETMLVKKSVYNSYGYYDESYTIIADYAYMMNIYHGGASFYHVKSSLLYFRNTGASNTEDRKRSLERIRLFRSYFPFLDDDDLDKFKMKGRIPVKDRLDLINKHQGKSELFARSMAYNIADQAVIETRQQRSAREPRPGLAGAAILKTGKSAIGRAIRYLRGQNR